METKYVVDNIIEDIVVLENLETRDIVNINKYYFNFDIKVGDVIVYKDGTYYNDYIERENRFELIKTKFDRVRRK